MKNVTHIFFDLDHTLWDTDKNSEESLQELFLELNLEQAGIPSFPVFHKQYRQHNQRLWGLYAENQVGKDAVRLHRFLHTLQDFGIHDDGETAKVIAEKFISITPYKLHLIAGAKELLSHLHGRYNLSIITNGFSESQYIKLKQSGIDIYFDHVFISEEIGINKPDPAIFHHAVKLSGALGIENCVMVGDTYETDIVGAISCGMKAVYLESSYKNEQVNPSVIKIKLLEELHSIF
jgi:putative hydrolase of the HAD superfamily